MQVYVETIRQQDAVQCQVVEKQYLHCIPSDPNISGLILFLMKIQTTALRTLSFVNFILPQICLQTRQNLRQDFQKD